MERRSNKRQFLISHPIAMTMSMVAIGLEAAKPIEGLGGLTMGKCKIVVTGLLRKIDLQSFRLRSQMVRNHVKLVLLQHLLPPHHTIMACCCSNRNSPSLPPTASSSLTHKQRATIYYDVIQLIVISTTHFSVHFQIFSKF